ncbi:MAG: ECF transporter S component [Bacillota bacterium]|nr:ECF transporter S component [Bacillota bacterium]
MNNKRILRIVVIGLLAALSFTGTYIHIPLPFLGPNSMMHLGTTVIYLSAVLIGPDAGWAGAVGCSLFDLFQMPVYAVPTFIIKGLQGYAAGKISFAKGKEGNSIPQNLFGFIAGAVISLAGYFIADTIIYGNWRTALTSTIGSLLTSGVGIVFALVIASIIKPLLKKANIRL